MRSPGRRRPLSNKPVAPPADVDVGRAAAAARYVGSPEHKTYVSADRPPRLRADATPCPPDLKDVQELTDWIRAGIRAGLTGGMWEQGFPRYVWWREEERCFQARLMNVGAGEYKGWPLPHEEWPAELRP